jgi:hypothetical protein
VVEPVQALQEYRHYVECASACDGHGGNSLRR